MGEFSETEECEVVAVAVEPPPPPTAFQNFTKNYSGIIFGLLAAVFYSLSSVTATKTLAADPIILSSWRFSATLPLAYPLYGLTLYFNGLKTRSYKILPYICTLYDRKTTFFIFAQCLLWTNSTILFYFGIKYLSYGDTVMITSTSPIGVSILTCLIERSLSKGGCGVIPVLSTFLTIISVLVVSKPPILTGTLPSSSPGDTLLGIIFAVGSMLVISISTVMIKNLREVNTALIMVLSSIWGIFQTTLIAYFMGLYDIPQNHAEVGWVFLVACFSYFARICTTMASKHESPALVSLTRVTEVPISMFLQALVLKTSLDIYSGIGAVLMLIAVGLSTGTKIVSTMKDESKWKTRFEWLLR